MLGAIAAGRFAYVLAPRATGKSSLMGRAIRRLRADAQLAAVVDLNQIAARTESVDSARWHYSIAYRISRELRLKVDLQAWWHERSLLLNEQRLVEFFWDVVLAHTSVAVTIFFDEAEKASDLSFSGELFAALQSCYQRRVSEPEYARLNFVVLGAASPAQLCPDPSVSPFASGARIRLQDFTVEQCFGLAHGLELSEHDAAQVIEQIYLWTHGQPYLTQKLARGVARKGGGSANVDAVVHALFLAPGISREEPYLSQMRSMLTDGSVIGRKALAVLKRLSKGGEVIDDPASAAQALLQRGGFVSSDENGMLRFGNRIVEQVFDASWSQTIERPHWQPRAKAAAIAATVLALVTYWYFGVLPRPYIDTLTFVSSDYALATQAHQRLQRLPGFSGRADRLLTGVMVRRSNGAETIAEAEAADAALRSLPDRIELADRLMASFWLRRAEAAAHRADRDSALVYAIAAFDSGFLAASVVAANLIDGDYLHLQQSTDLGLSLRNIEVDWQRGQIVGVDETERLHRLPLDRVSSSGASNSQQSTMPLTALQQVGVTRGFFVDDPGRAGALQLRVTVDHARPSDLLVRLRAPSGAAAELGLPDRDGGLEQFVFTASVQNGLLRLADESTIGQWELTVFDRLSGETGRLVNWGLSFPGVPQFWDDEPVEGIPMPDPDRTEQIIVALAGDGRRAITVPSRLDVRGAASVWDLGSNELIADLPLTDRADLVEFIGSDHLLVSGPLRAMLWHLSSSELVAEFVSASGFSARPTVSSDGSYLAVAENLGLAANGGIQVSLISVASGEIVTRFTTAAWSDWDLAANAAYLATIDGSRRGLLIDPSTGDLRAEFFHERELDRVMATSDRIIAVDRLGEIVTWPLETGRAALTPADSLYVGRSTDPQSLVVSSDGSMVSYVGEGGLLSVSALGDGHRRAVFDGGGGGAVAARLSPNADRLVSAVGTTIRSWRVPGAESAEQNFGDVSIVALDSSGELGLLGYRSGKVDLLDGLPGSIEQDGAPAVDYFGHRGVVTSLAVSRSGELAASGGSDGLVRVWNARDRSPRRYHLRHPSGPINSLAISADDLWLISAAPGSARVFNLETGEMVNEIEVEGEAVAVAIAPDNRLVAVGDSAGNIVLAAPDGRQGVLTIRVRSPIATLKFADTAAILASGTDDGNLVFWDTLEARAIGGAQAFSDAIDWIEFSEDAEQVFVQSGAWVHQVDRSQPDFSVTASSLLPGRVRHRPALTPIAARTIRAVSHAGAGRIEFADIEMLPAVNVESDAATAGLNPFGLALAGVGQDLVRSRDWPDVLGLGIDPQSGEVRPIER